MKDRGYLISSPWQKPVSKVHRWLLATVMLCIIAIGWRYPFLGFLVPVVMLTGILGSFLRGRYVCGNICPRGSFYDTAFRFIGGTRPIPPILKAPAFRWTFMLLLMSGLAVQISRSPQDPLHWGFVFWMACAATTALGVLLGSIYRARTWCAFCPVGTMGASFGGERYRLRIADSCRSCGTCEKSCSMGFSIKEHKAQGILPHRDCLKCSSCVEACPSGALSWPNT